jgi:hypothetical protein
MVENQGRQAPNLKGKKRIVLVKNEQRATH